MSDDTFGIDENEPGEDLSQESKIAFSPLSSVSERIEKYNVNQSIVKFKDLKEFQKREVLSSYQEVNDDFEFILVRSRSPYSSSEEKNKILDALDNELKNSSKISTIRINSTESKKGFKSILIPRIEVFAQNTSLKQTNNFVNVIENFSYLASILLIEPHVYCENAEEVKAEKDLITKTFGTEFVINPCFYNYLIGLIYGKEASNLLSISAVAATAYSATLAVAFFTSVGALAGPPGWLVGLGASLVGVGLFGLPATNFDGLFDDLTESSSSNLNFKRIYAGGVSFSFKDIDASLFKDIKEFNEMNFDYDNFHNHVGRADEIDSAIEYFVEDIYMKSKCFSLLERLANDIESGARVAALLKNPNNNPSKEEGENNLSIFSNEVIGQEVATFLSFVLSFPTIEEFGPDEEDAVDVFSLTKEGKVVTDNFLDSFEDAYYLDGSRVGSGNHLFDYQVQDGIEDFSDALQKSYFNKNKQRLKNQNRKTLAYLKTLLDALIEEVAISNIDIIHKSDPALAKALGEQDIFKLLEDDAYPDIITPRDPILSKVKTSANRLPLDFYYFKLNNLNALNLTPGEREKGEKVLKRSKDFITNLSKTGITSIRKDEATSIFSSGMFFNFGNLSYKDPEAEIEIGQTEPNSNQQNLVTPPMQLEPRSLNDLNEGQASQYLTNLRNNYINQINASNVELSKIRSVFGSKFGYIAQDSPSYFDEASGAINDDKFFDLCKDSFLSLNEQEGMIKAFPTFRLYLVEEDSIYSDRLLAFDDFFYYNSVIAFNVHTSRELAASTATIQLQNISGLLDGTRKSVMRDIDFGEARVSHENEDQLPTIESVVLRPGVNIQLRAGYSNNTNELDVLISGKVTEISYSGDNMVCSIVVQGYGIELDSLKYGVSSSNQTGNKFYSTHQLLGTLLLSPQLKHFGRVKTGKLFQSFESKIPSFDMETYTRDGGWTFNWLNTWNDFLSDHSGKILFGFILLSAAAPSLRALKEGLARVPVIGKVGSGISAIGNKISSIGISKVFGPLAGGAVAGSKFIAGTKAFQLISIPFKKFNNLFGKKFTQAELDELVKLADDLAIGPSVAPGTVFDFTARGLSQGFMARFNEVASRGGFYVGAVTTEQTRQVVQTLLREELGILGAKFGLGGSRSFAGLGVQEIIDISLANATRAERFFSWLGTVAKGNLMISGKMILYGSAVSLGILAPELIVESVASVFNFFASYFSETKRPYTRKILLAPQDDNLWCPRPESYLKRNDEDLNGLLLAFKKYVYSLKTITNQGLFGFGPFDLNSESVSGLLNDAIRKARGFIDKRMDTSRFENEYVLTSQSAWEVLHEMSLRHPGYIYGIRPYGNTLEYRVFFGLPGQRYFRKDISNYSVYRLNSIYSKISNLNNNKLSNSEIALLFPEESAQWDIVTSGIREDILKSIPKEEYFTNYALNEWLTKTKDRFVPYRQYHLVKSSKNLIANNVIVSGHNVNAAVSVHYSIMSNSGDTAEVDATSVWRAVANSNIPPEATKESVVKYENIKGVANACRYAIGELLYGAKKMYEGSLLTLGNSKINPLDIIILNDNVNLIYGPLGVKAVTHMFSHESGFITDVEIEAVVAPINDTLTYPMLHQTVFFEARKEMFEEYANKASFNYANVGNQEIKEIIGDKVNDYVEKIIEEGGDLSGFDFWERGTLTDPEVLKRVKEQLSLEFIKYFEEKSNYQPFFQQDIVSENARIPKELEAPLRKTALITAGAAVGLTGLEAATYHIFKSNGINLFGATSVTQRMPFMIGAALTGASLLIAAVPSTVRNYLSDSLQSGWLGKNIFRPTILSKVDNTDVIKIFPLVKDGKPLLAGGFEHHAEEERYQNVLGNIYSSVSDGYKGFLEYSKIIDSYKGKSFFGNVPEWIKETVINTDEGVSVVNYELNEEALED